MEGSVEFCDVKTVLHTQYKTTSWEEMGAGRQGTHPKTLTHVYLWKCDFWWWLSLNTERSVAQKKRTHCLRGSEIHHVTGHRKSLGIWSGSRAVGRGTLHRAFTGASEDRQSKGAEVVRMADLSPVGFGVFG